MTSACDVVLIGAGIMSATLGMLLRQLDPSLRIVTFERLDRAAAESSDAWNNAGTGHAGYCELNYTPAAADGSVDVGKAVKIAGQFGESLAFWRALVADGVLPQTPSFIRRVPHLSFVTGERDVAYLRARVAGLRASPRFADLEHSEDPATLASWMPLVMEGRAAGIPGRGHPHGARHRRQLRRADPQHVHLARRRNPASRCGCPTRSSTCAATAPAGPSTCATSPPGPSARSPPASSSSAPAATPSGSSSRPGSPRPAATARSRSAGSGCAAPTATVIARHHAKVYGQAEVGAPPMSRAAPRHPVDRRDPGAPVRALRRLDDEVPEAGLGVRLCSARSASTTCARW
jgi:malate dehydrogenase (quinone)